MAESLAIDNLNLSDNERYSSSKYKRNLSTSQTPQTPANPTSARSDVKSSEMDMSPREVALQAELQSLQNINKVIEGVVSSLERAKANMSTVNQTVNHASTLLDKWTRILSQTEHNQRLILNPAWQGATQDLADTENETMNRHRERERQETEEAQRREMLRKEEERRKPDAFARAEASASGSTASVGRGGGSMRGRGKVPSSGYGRVPSGERGKAGQRGRPAGSGYGKVGSAGTTRGDTGRGGRGRGMS